MIAVRSEGGVPKLVMFVKCGGNPKMKRHVTYT